MNKSIPRLSNIIESSKYEDTPVVTFGPLISIITVVLNDEKHIEPTILSVIHQSYINIEYIVIDGGSSDATIDIVKKHENKISHWVSEPDMGIYNAMNKGIQKSKGEWLIFMNSGDVFNNNNVLQQIFSNFITTSTHLIYGNTIVKDDKTTIKPSQIIDKNFFFFNTICHQSIFFKRVAFEMIGFYDLKYKIISDREFLMHAIIKKLNFTYIDLDVCIWASEGFTSKNLSRYHNEETDMRNSYFNFLEILLLHLRKITSYYTNKLYSLFLLTLGLKK